MTRRLPCPPAPGPARPWARRHRDSSLAYDLGRKARLYARHGVPELWVLDQRGDRLVAHHDPTPRSYSTVRTLGRGEMIAPLAFPEIALPVDLLLGEPAASSAATT